MARTYQLKRRAERQQETRQRIVEAAVSLHTTIGPARTTVSAIAERAGVQRHTFYRHFPDDRSLWLACSGLWQERHPLPDPAAWRRIDDGEARLRRGLGEVYAFYEANADAMAPLVRDAEVHRLTRDTLDLRMRDAMAAIHSALAEGFAVRGARRRRLDAAIGLFMDFAVWRRLRADAGSPSEALDAAVRAICAQ